MHFGNYNMLQLYRVLRFHLEVRNTQIKPPEDLILS